MISKLKKHLKNNKFNITTRIVVQCHECGQISDVFGNERERLLYLGNRKLWCPKCKKEASFNLVINKV